MKLVYINNELQAGYGGFDLTFDNDIYSQYSLSDAVLLSLFCWKRALPEEVSKGDRLGGWWGDINLGSKLFLTQRAKVNDSLLPRVEQAVLDSLQWMILTKVAKEVTCKAYLDPTNTIIRAEITITKPDNNKETYKFNDLWANQLET